MNLRARLLTAVAVSCVVAAALGFYVVMQESAEAARNRLLLDVLLLAAMSGSVFVITRNPLERREELLDAMRALARGVRERRLEPERFGDLEDIARSYNEVAASLSEHDDPNLGPVRARRRHTRPAWMDPEGSEHPELGEVRVISRKEKASSAERDSRVKARTQPPTNAPRRRRREDLASDLASSAEANESAAESAAEAAASAEAAEDVLERPRAKAEGKRGRRRNADKSREDARDEAEDARAHEAAVADDASAHAEAPADAAEGEPETPESEPIEHEDALDSERELAAEDDAESADNNDTAIDDLLARAPMTTDGALPREEATAGDGDEPPSDDGTDESDSASPAASGTPSTLQPFDMRALFREFVEAKRAHDEDTDDLEFEAFAETLEEEMERLVAAHGCRAVRFEVRVQDGEVSLLPRLLR